MRMKRFLANMLLIPAAIGLVALAGCEGSEAKKAITDVINQVLGGEVVKKGQEMKEQIDQVVKQEVKRLTKMDHQKKEEGSAGESEEGSEKKSDQ
jgi:hypothetical protein